MQISQVDLSNYRNFQQFSLKFGSEATIIIGKNGAGKSNLIKSVKQLLSFIFSRRKGEPQYNFIASSDRNVISYTTVDAHYGRNNESGEFTYFYPICNTLVITVKDRQSFKVTYEKEALTSGLKEKPYREANETFWQAYNYGNGNLPVFAYFSDSYPHINSQLPKAFKEMLESGRPLSRNMAYFKWDDDKCCTDMWLQYFMMQYKKSRLENDKAASAYISAIQKALISASTPVSEFNPDNDIALAGISMDFRGATEVVIMEFADGRRIPFVQLPTGYLRIFSIVLDIATRSYLLNQTCDSSGIVLIDELDLHLHPTLERTVFKRLRRTFPHMQWIATTHSPLVLSAFEQKDNSNLIYKITKTEHEILWVPVANMQGVDASTGLRDTMDTPEDDSRLNDLKEAYDYWKAKGDNEKLQNIKNIIKTMVGENSLLYKTLS